MKIAKWFWKEMQFLSNLLNDDMGKICGVIFILFLLISVWIADDFTDSQTPSILIAAALILLSGVAAISDVFIDNDYYHGSFNTLEKRLRSVSSTIFVSTILSVLPLMIFLAPASLPAKQIGNRLLIILILATGGLIASTTLAILARYHYGRRGKRGK